MPDFMGPKLWPPNSPDLNVVHYGIWGILLEHVYSQAQSWSTVEKFKQWMVNMWPDVKQSVVDKAHEQVVAKVAGLHLCWKTTFLASVVML